MKTARQIVEYIRNHPVTYAPHADCADTMLHERAKAFKGQPAEKLEGHLAWAVNSVASAVRTLKEAAAEDARRVEQTVIAAQGLTLESSLRGFGWSGSKTDACRVRLEDAVETLRCVLDVYEVTAKDA